jgi:hypothetical protein
MKRLIVCASVLTLMACGTKSAVVGDNSATKTIQTVGQDKAEQLRKEQTAFVQKIADNALYQQNVVSKLSFTLNSGTKNITVPGSIHMRKDDVIRIQLFMPLLGTEVGRLEFTKDYVLIIDRIHKQYIKGDYNKVEFLSRHGINFNALQSLFWNQLFLPGAEKMTDAELGRFSVELPDADGIGDVSLLQQKMLFRWKAEKDNGNITAAHIAYKGDSHDDAELNWKYDTFRAFGSKQFPHYQVINFKMDKKDVTVTLDMNGVTADSNWDARTSVSSKYKEVTVEDVLKQLTSL